MNPDILAHGIAAQAAQTTDTDNSRQAMAEHLKSIGPETKPAGSASLADATRDGIAAWLQQYMADLTELDIAEIDIHSTFERYGFDSYQGVVMTHELAAWLGSELDSTDTFDHPTIARLAEFLAADPRNQAAFARLGSNG